MEEIASPKAVQVLAQAEPHRRQSWSLQVPLPVGGYQKL